VSQKLGPKCDKCGGILKQLFTSWYCDCEKKIEVEDKKILFDKETLQWMEDGGIGE